ncbi:MAG TPA: winged helix-turn-helix transcriptional regulator [Candidatus Eisenbacteria bacterium]|nr:winged helix-turn-helix transcriptional regulator [Candidatus Eisenbacteria bacterium]
MKSYGQYCPIARTSELLAERWTPILLRNLLAGCSTFGELLEGAPGISRALLAQRLELLERQGILTKKVVGTGRCRCYYALTDKGRELKNVTDAMGMWGARWLEIEPHHADPAYVLWATCRLVDLARLPKHGFVVQVILRDRTRKSFWLLLRQPRAEVCTSYPGRSPDLVMTSDSGTLAHWHLRHIDYQDATRTGRLRIEGPPMLVKRFLTALRPSPYAQVLRASAAGIKRRTGR